MRSKLVANGIRGPEVSSFCTFLGKVAMRRLAPVRLAPGREVVLRALVGRGVEAKDRAALAHLFGDEILEGGHLVRLLGNLVREVRRYHHHAFAVANHDVARPDRRVATADGYVDVQRLVLR